MNQSIEDSQETDPKLDIFKCLQLILEKILQTKAKISQQLQPLTAFYGEADSSLFADILSLWTFDPERIMFGLRTHRLAYGSRFTPDNFASLAMIEGFSIDILPFIEIEKTYKLTILKKLIGNTQSNNKLIQ